MAVDGLAGRSVVFMGSGPVAAKSLELVLKHTQVEAVITKPTTLWQMAAVADEIPIHTVSNRAELDQLLDAQKFASHAGLLIDFGIIVSQHVIDAFPLGIVNSHFSILPELRGADPISFAILSGQSVTGVSLMLLVEKMDEGPIIGYGEQQLSGTETTPILTDQLIKLSDALIRDLLPQYLSGNAKPGKQELSGRTASYSRKLTKEDGVMDFNKPAEQLEREVRAFIDWPKTRTSIGGKDVIITTAHAGPAAPGVHTPGEVAIVKQPKSLYIHCQTGCLFIDRLKPAGKADMSTDAFLAGYTL